MVFRQKTPNTGLSFIRIVLVCRVLVSHVSDKHPNNICVAAHLLMMALEESRHISSNVSTGGDDSFWGIAISTGD
jgi:hypothetical protein